MKKSLATILVLSSIALASNEYGNRANYQENTRSSAHRGSLNGKSGNKTDDRSGKISDNYMDSVIYTDIIEMGTHGRRQQISNARASKTIILGQPATEAAEGMASLLAAEELAREKDAAIKRKIPSYYTGGFCSVVTPADISKSSEFTTLECLLDFGGEIRRADVFVGLYPDHKREMLVGVPIYITFENGNRASFDGIVLRKNKGSMNLSDWTDNKRIRKLLAEGALIANDIAYVYGTRYLNALEESNTKQKTDYITVSDNNGSTRIIPVTSTSNEKPKAKNYLIAAGLELLTSLFSMAGKSYLYDAKPLFRMYSGKKVYLEGVVSFDNARLGKKFGIIGTDEQRAAKINNQGEEALMLKKIQSYGVTRGGKIQIGEGN